MRKHVMALVLCLTMSLALVASAAATNLYVDTVLLSEELQTVTYNGDTYVSIREITSSLLPEASIYWDGTQAVVSYADILNITATPGNPYIIANGRYLYLPERVQLENNAVMVSLETLVKALDAAVLADNEDMVSLMSGTGAIVSADSYYNADDLHWLSRIIYAESGNQSLEGQIAVGNVILNRVRNSQFPNTIYDVIFQRNQFTPASSGSINKAPNASSIIAAKLCLDGAVVLSNGLFFNRADQRSWASRNRTYVTTIGAHAFYS